MHREDGERRYQVAMSIAAGMVKKGIIDGDDYRAFETKMRAKYRPVFGDLFWDKPPEKLDK